MKKNYDVVIIGSGIGGLVCGCYLAKKGLSVLILEQHSAAGGYCASFQRKGFNFDVAVHFLGGIKNNILGQVLEELGLRSELKLNSVDPSYKIVMPDFVINVSSTSQDFVKEFQKAFPDEKRNIRKFFDFILQKNFLRMFSRINKITFAHFLDDYFSNYNLKSTLNVLMGNIGVSSDKVSALTALILLRTYVFVPAFYPVGGMQKFPDSLVTRFLKLGGDILFSSRVNRILTKNCYVKGVILSEGNEVESRVIVSNVDATETFSRLLDIDTIEARRTKDLILSPATFMTYLGLNLNVREKVKELGCIACCSTYDPQKHFSLCEDNILCGKLPLVVISFPSSHDKSIKTRGKSTIELFSFAPYLTYEFWEENRDLMAEKMISIAEKALCPFRQYIEIKETGTPWTFNRYTSNRNGSAYGWSASIDQTTKKIMPQKTSIHGLYLAGHWASGSVVPGGIPGVAFSGRTASQLILKDLGFPKEGNDFLFTTF